MQEMLANWIPHVMERLPDLWEAAADTLLMVLWSGAISFLLGMLLGALLTVTKPGAWGTSPSATATTGTGPT